MSDEGEIIGDIKKDDNNVIRISIQEYNGHRYIDIRKCFQNGKGHMFRTKQGVTISKRNINLFMLHMEHAQGILMEKEPF
ncbi:MAG: transcriptional coactivator p15/PC4 family protein [Thermodesulfovibrionales bacterium]|nr:transcriptional coactivator p15/PC4 family protein [Thermodesulfovibrionales bacterium]